MVRDALAFLEAVLDLEADLVLGGVHRGGGEHRTQLHRRGAVGHQDHLVVAPFLQAAHGRVGVVAAVVGDGVARHQPVRAVERDDVAAGVDATGPEAGVAHADGLALAGHHLDIAARGDLGAAQHLGPHLRIDIDPGGGITHRAQAREGTAFRIAVALGIAVGAQRHVAAHVDHGTAGHFGRDGRVDGDDGLAAAHRHQQAAGGRLGQGLAAAAAGGVDREAGARHGGIAHAGLAGGIGIGHRLGRTHGHAEGQRRAVGMGVGLVGHGRQHLGAAVGVHRRAVEDGRADRGRRPGAHIGAVDRRKAAAGAGLAQRRGALRAVMRGLHGDAAAGVEHATGIGRDRGGHLRIGIGLADGRHQADHQCVRRGLGAAAGIGPDGDVAVGRDAAAQRLGDQVARQHRAAIVGRHADQAAGRCRVGGCGALVGDVVHRHVATGRQAGAGHHRGQLVVLGVGVGGGVGQRAAGDGVGAHIAHTNEAADAHAVAGGAGQVARAGGDADVARLGGDVGTTAADVGGHVGRRLRQGHSAHAAEEGRAARRIGVGHGVQAVGASAVVVVAGQHVDMASGRHIGGADHGVHVGPHAGRGVAAAERPGTADADALGPRIGIPERHIADHHILRGADRPARTDAGIDHGQHGGHGGVAATRAQQADGRGVGIGSGTEVGLAGHLQVATHGAADGAGDGIDRAADGAAGHGLAAGTQQGAVHAVGHRGGLGTRQGVEAHAARGVEDNARAGVVGERGIHCRVRVGAAHRDGRACRRRGARGGATLAGLAAVEGQRQRHVAVAARRGDAGAIAHGGGHGRVQVDIGHRTAGAHAAGELHAIGRAGGLGVGRRAHLHRTIDVDHRTGANAGRDRGRDGAGGSGTGAGDEQAARRRRRGDIGILVGIGLHLQPGAGDIGRAGGHGAAGRGAGGRHRATRAQAQAHAQAGAVGHHPVVGIGAHHRHATAGVQRGIALGLGAGVGRGAAHRRGARHADPEADAGAVGLGQRALAALVVLGRDRHALPAERGGALHQVGDRGGHLGIRRHQAHGTDQPQGEALGGGGGVGLRFGRDLDGTRTGDSAG